MVYTIHHMFYAIPCMVEMVHDELYVMFIIVFDM